MTECLHTERPKLARGMCGSCYSMDWHRRHPGARAAFQAKWRGKGEPCGIAGCPSNRQNRRLYCEKHYGRLRAGKALDGLTELICGSCGEGFRGRDNGVSPRYCSTSCFREARTIRTRGRHYGKRSLEQERIKHEARYAVEKLRRYQRQDIFERDGWLCGICARPVDPASKFPDYWSPSIDHIVPISRGGDEAASNVRLTHFGCNSRRGARVAA